MKIKRLQHTSIPMPPGGNDEARRFYTEVLGLREVPSPSTLHQHRLVWFSLGDDGDELHLLTEEGFAPGTNGQHLCMVTDDVDAFRAHLASQGVDIGEEPPIHHRPRFSFRDPFGNKIEITSITGDYLEAES